MTILKQLIPLMQFSTGQRLRILHRLRQRALEHGFRELLPLIDRAIEREQRTQALENNWPGRSMRSPYTDQVVDIDAIVDQLLGGLRDVARGHIRGLPADDPMAVMCEHFLTEVFPNGLQAVVSLPFVDQVAAVEVIVGKLGGELADTVRALGLEQKRERLAELTVEYRRLVDEIRSEMRFTDIREARALGHELLRQIIVMVLGRFHDAADPDHLAARDALLAPLIIQLDETRARARARRRNRADESDASGPGDSGDDLGDDDLVDAADDLGETTGALGAAEDQPTA